MNELQLQAVIAELENQRNFFQLRCIQLAQEIAKQAAEVRRLTEELNPKE